MIKNQEYRYRFFRLLYSKYLFLDDIQCFLYLALTFQMAPGNINLHALKFNTNFHVISKDHGILSG